MQHLAACALHDQRPVVLVRSKLCLLQFIYCCVCQLDQTDWTKLQESNLLPSGPGPEAHPLRHASITMDRRLFRFQTKRRIMSVPDALIPAFPPQWRIRDSNPAAEKGLILGDLQACIRRIPLFILKLFSRAKSGHCDDILSHIRACTAVVTFLAGKQPVC